MLDAVHVADFERWQPPTEYMSSFDVVVFADVLEHLVDPSTALRRAASLLSANGIVIASIPNVRWLPVLWGLAIRGEWRYEVHGVLDETHLRFFTKRSIWRLFETSGFQIDRYTPALKYPWPRFLCPPFAVLAKFSGVFEELHSFQYIVRACKAPNEARE